MAARRRFLEVLQRLLLVVKSGPATLQTLPHPEEGAKTTRIAWLGGRPLKGFSQEREGPLVLFGGEHSFWGHPDEEHFADPPFASSSS
jgi:hypothetical protein